MSAFFFLVYSLLLGQLAQSFTTIIYPKIIKRQPYHYRYFLAEDDTTTEKDSMSFDSASQALRKQEEEERLERSGNLLNDEKQAEFDALRERVRRKASSLNIEKSITTEQMIQKANEQAQSGEKPILDLDKFSGADETEEELTEEEKKEIDKIGQLPILQQAIEELKLVKWPSASSTLRLTFIMFIVFVVTATYLLVLDNTLRTLVTKFGLIPPKDAVFDFSDMELPDKWTEFMNDGDLVNMGK